MYIKYLFLSILSLFLLMSLNSNLVYADPDCDTQYAPVTYYDLPSLMAAFPYSGFQVGYSYRYSVPNSECVARNMYYYPYPYPYAYPYPYPGYPDLWRWELDSVSGGLLKVHRFCFQDHFLGALVFRCR